jgi:hypothetical protein
MANPQFFGKVQPLPLNQWKRCLVERLLVSPFRFCGRQWMWIRNDNNSQISQVALKIFIVPFLVCATLMSGLPAVIGTLIYSSGNIPAVTVYQPMGDINLLRKDISNKQIAKKIKELLRNVGHEYSIKVQSMNRGIINDYYPKYIHRYITLINPSNTAITRFCETLKNHFYNKDVFSLNSLHSCLYDSGVGTPGLAQLKDVLALYKAVTFSLAFDLAYVHTELSRGT